MQWFRRIPLAVPCEYDAHVVIKSKKKPAWSEILVFTWPDPVRARNSPCNMLSVPTEARLTLIVTKQRSRVVNSPPSPPPVFTGSQVQVSAPKPAVLTQVFVFVLTTSR